MEYIIITIAVLAGVVIDYVNGRKNADEDWELRIMEVAAEIIAEEESGKDGTLGGMWRGGAAWAIRKVWDKDG